MDVEHGPACTPDDAVPALRRRLLLPPDPARGAGASSWRSPGWLPGAGTALGLCGSAFATLAGLHGRDARGTITGVAPTAGFAGAVGCRCLHSSMRPWGWRGACSA